jgi:two-component system OmpR family response regulator
MAKIKFILYAEDDAVVRRVYQQCLERAGYYVISVDDGMEAIKQLKMSAPDLMILDLMMPNLSGEDVLHFVCNEAHLHDKPLIIMSENSQVEKGYEEFSGRADAYLVKRECTPAILLQKVQELLAGPQMESAADPDDLSDESLQGALPVNHGADVNE